MQYRPSVIDIFKDQELISYIATHLVVVLGLLLDRPSSEKPKALSFQIGSG